jgi:hypothetical protein
MWINEDERPRGYEYPPPSIEGGSTQEPRSTPRPLSPENVRKIRDTIRRNEAENSGAVHTCK